MGAIIETKNLTHTYSQGTPFEHTALDCVDFSAAPGEYLAVIGRTGSGKSTLIQHLNGLLKPTSGQVLFDGADIWESKSRTRQVRCQVGLVFQYPEYQLFEETVYQDIAFGPKNMGLDADEVDRRVKQSARFGGLEPAVLEKSPFDLSGGQKRRVAIAGNNFALSVFSDSVELEKPEYATPLGIAISAGLGLLNDSYVVTLNGQSAKLFRNGVLTLRDILLMNGYSYGDMVGKTGKSLSVTLDGKRLVFRGEPAVPAVLRVNEEEAALSTVIHAGDHIHFVPARHGAGASRTVAELLGPEFYGKVMVNNSPASMDTQLGQGDVVLTLRQTPPTPRREAVPQEAWPSVTPTESPVRPASSSGELHISLNGEPLILPAREDRGAYHLMDLLEYSDIDFEHLDRAVRLEVNGVERGFQYTVKAQDRVTISLI